MRGRWRPLVESDGLALGRYGARQVTVTIRTRSPELLRDALTAVAVGELPDPGDPRDLMVALAPHVHAARVLGRDPALLFADVADRLPAGDLAALPRTFGARKDVTLRAFLWRIVETPDGPDFVPDSR